MANTKTGKRTRVGRVTIYEHHGAWYTYHRQDGKALRRRVGSSEAQAECVASLLNAKLSAYSDFSADASYDPGPFLRLIDVPMYYVFGETDVNVPTEQSVEFLEVLREDFDKDISYVVLEGVGHSLANWTGVLTAGYVPKYLALVETWPVDQIR